ncbi:hypothetical protein COHA_008904 [Chlorella ohadii]|uniref:GDP-D-glucose phosphorylase 1 n=1 Tax=Chlorella ohadii TaxID=2649997 RepID=A0AAD5H233_9CHLO|nr:hypothetical protein COHA_008904 [Chlorella ohadii]
MPLTLTRTPTIYSLNQLDADEPGCPLAAPAKGVLSTPDKAVRELAGGASLLPLYTFPSADGFASKKVRSFGSFQDLAAAGGSGPAVPDVDEEGGLLGASDDDSLSQDGSSDSGTQVVPQRSVLDALLLGEWEDRAEAGLFRYDVTACPTKLVPGSYGFIAQCNEGRLSKKRPTEFRIDQVAQPFDDGKFNFKKALQKEVLFMFEPAARRITKPAFQPAAAPRTSPSLVYINVSPIEYGHVLLVPRVLDDLQQLVTPDTLLLALQFAREADNPYFRLAYNSLGAYGTINHLHFQAYYLAAPYAMERAPTAPLDAAWGLGPAAALLQACCQPLTHPQLYLPLPLQLAELVGTACQRLTAANVPHNLFIADCGARVFLFPNCFAEKKARGLIPEDVLETQVDPAAWEIAGHIVLKRQEDYDTVTQASAWHLLEYASCSEQRFGEVARIALGGLL